jgi:glycerol kinase
MEPPERYILAIDQSTSATKVMLFDHLAELTDRVSIFHKQYYPQPGFVEHDPEVIFKNTLQGINQLFRQSGISASEISTISITNQRETAMIWNRQTGKPVANAAVWQCQRGVPYCNMLKKEGHEPLIRDKTGLVIDSYFSASKLHWFMENVPGLAERAQKGELLMGTMDSWLLWKLTAGKVHATDYSNASRTMLFNIHTLQWDEELMPVFGLEPSMLPQLKFSDEVFGTVDHSFEGIGGLPISGLMGDSHAALFGQHCFTVGMSKATYGTGSSVMINIGRQPMNAPEGLVTSVGFGRNGQIDYVFEGNIHSTGDTINWMTNDLQLIGSPPESESVALTVENNGGVYLVPAFVGLGAPYWDHEARACIIGMGRDTKKAHIVRAGLESIAYQIKDLMDQMISGTEIGLRELRVDGGPTRNGFLMQFQADMLQKPVVRAGIEEISALGSAFMAGLANGFWKDLEEIEQLRVVDRTFSPKMSESGVNKNYEGWKTAISRAMLKVKREK